MEETPEDRLEQFAKGLEENNMDLMPPTYNTTDPSAFIADLRAVLTRLKAAEGAWDHG